MAPKNRALIGGAVVAASMFGACTAFGLERPACWTAAITALCAIWWVTEALPLPATSLVPFATLPMTGVLDHTKVAQAYGHHLILLLLGGFILSKAVERSGAHRRMALAMVRAFGRFGRRGMVLGFMTATAVMSMWISNTATVLVMLPVALAVLERDEDRELRVPLLLGIAYAGSIGGLGTPIGTPPNLACMAVFEESTGAPIAFTEWMSWGVPVVVLMIPIAWLSLTRNVRRGPLFELPDPGPWRKAEVRVLVVFSLAAAAWILRRAPFGGWNAWIPYAGDETVALLAVCVLFAMPDGKGERMLDWETAASIPWGLLILFGGGLAIASAFQESGLSAVVGAQLEGLRDLPPLLVIGGVCLSVTFLTELTSNTATTVLLMPILAAASIETNIDPRVLMVPAAMSASCAFMLPVATAPNAIMFGTGAVPIRRMALEGLRLNLFGAAVITVICFLVLG